VPAPSQGQAQLGNTPNTQYQHRQPSSPSPATAATAAQDSSSSSSRHSRGLYLQPQSPDPTSPGTPCYRSCGLMAQLCCMVVRWCRVWMLWCTAQGISTACHGCNTWACWKQVRTCSVTHAALPQLFPSFCRGCGLALLSAQHNIAWQRAASCVFGLCLVQSL
jgi:hypothetical protein